MDRLKGRLCDQITKNFAERFYSKDSKMFGISRHCISHRGKNVFESNVLAQNRGSKRLSVELRPIDRIILVVIGIAVIFASLGLGEAVYRLAFLDFDGATDRLPIELFFGLAFAWGTAKLARNIYQHRMETFTRIKLIRDRNHKIRHAAEAIAPLAYPNNHQAIRVIREEVDRIEWALTEIIP